jgi:hypothetical protein
VGTFSHIASAYCIGGFLGVAALYGQLGLLRVYAEHAKPQTAQKADRQLRLYKENKAMYRAASFLLWPLVVAMHFQAWWRFLRLAWMKERKN